MRHVIRTVLKARVPYLILTVLAVSLALTACGGGGSSSSDTEASGASAEGQASTSDSAEQPAKGAPIVTLTYTDVNTEGPSYKNNQETVRVYQEWINTHGGIGGRPLEAHFCDSRGTSTAAAECARQAVSDKAVAVVSNFSFTGDAVVPILEANETALWANCCQVSPLEFTSKVSFPFGPSPLYAMGLVKKAVADKCENINAVIIEGAEAFEPLLENAAKAEGTKINKFVSLPGTAQDYSPQVAEATSGGADCLIMVVSETPFTAWMPAFAQSGSDARMYGPQGNFDEHVAEGFEEVVEGGVIADLYPDLSTAGWADYREALDTYDADPSLDYNSPDSLGTWAGYEAFKQVVESMKGPIDNRTFLKAAETAKIDLPGLLPPLNMAENWGNTGGPKGYERILNRCVAFSEFQGGKVVPVGNAFEDVSEIAGGTKPMDCGPPFG